MGGWGLLAATSSPARSPLRSAVLLTASHQTVGKAFFYNGSPGWTFMSVDIDQRNGTVICQLETPDGHFSTAGSFWPSDGDGSWGSADPASIGPVVGARLISSAGAVLATASISGH